MVFFGSHNHKSFSGTQATLSMPQIQMYIYYSKQNCVLYEYCHRFMILTSELAQCYAALSYISSIIIFAVKTGNTSKTSCYYILLFYSMCLDRIVFETRHIIFHYEQQHLKITIVTHRYNNNQYRFILPIREFQLDISVWINSEVVHTPQRAQVIA